MSLDKTRAALLEMTEARERERAEQMGKLQAEVEAERQRILVKKASIAQGRLLFVVNALRRLFADEHFVTLLRAERLVTLPTPIAERLNG